MASSLFLATSYFIGGLIVFFYCKSIYEVKKTTAFSFFVTIALYESLTALKIIFDNEVLNITAILVFNILIAYFLFKSSVKSSIFHGAVLVILQLVAEFVTSSTVALILNVSPKESVKNHFEIGMVLSLMMYFLLSRLLTAFSVKENKSRSWGKWFGLALLPVSSIVIIIAFRIIINDVVLTSVENSFMIISISFLLLVNIFVYFMYEQAEKNNQKLIELELVNQKNDIDMQYLDLLEKKNETMNIMAHDYKNNVLAIADMSDSPEIKKYVDDMVGEISKYNRVAKTKNRLLDVIINKYIDICDDKNIKFEITSVSDNFGFMSGYDLSSLFNNVLDNAVEAASESENKYIHADISNSIGSYHKLCVVNSCETAPNVKNGTLLTTKSNREMHGFGTKSIRKTVNKYDGEMQWDYDDNLKEFKLTVIFPQEA